MCVVVYIIHYYNQLSMDDCKWICNASQSCHTETYFVLMPTTNHCISSNSIHAASHMYMAV